MATQMDKKFSESVKTGVNALILEVERLETCCARLETHLLTAMSAIEQCEEREGYIGHQALKREVVALGVGYQPKHALDPI